MTTNQKQLVKQVKFFGHDVEIKDEKVMVEIWDENKGRYWTELESVAQYEKLVGKIHSSERVR